MVGDKKQFRLAKSVLLQPAHAKQEGWSQDVASEIMILLASLEAVFVTISVIFIKIAAQTFQGFLPAIFPQVKNSSTYASFVHYILSNFQFVLYTIADAQGRPPTSKVKVQPHTSLHTNDNKILQQLNMDTKTIARRIIQSRIQNFLQLKARINSFLEDEVQLKSKSIYYLDFTGLFCRLKVNITKSKDPITDFQITEPVIIV